MRRARVWLATWFAAWLLLYLGTLTSRYAYDGVAYCGEIVHALSRGSARGILHFSHLLFSPLALAVVWLTGGPAADLAVHVRLQVMQAFFGAATLTGLVLLLRKHVSTPVAASSAAMVGVTYAFWHYTTDVEVYSLAAGTVVVALAAARAALDKPGPALAAIAGLAAGVCALGHLTHGLLAGATGLLLLIWSPGRRLRTGLAFGGAFAGVLLATFGPILLGPLGADRPQGRLGFLLGYMQAGNREQALGWPWRDLQGSVATVVHALVASTPGWLVWLLPVAVIVLASAVAWAARRHSERSWRTAVLGISWLSVHSLFYFAWEHNEKYWISALVPAALLAALAAELMLRRLAPWCRALPALVVTAALLASNLPAIRHEMNPENNPALQVATSLRTATQPGSRVLLSGIEPWRELKVYVPYFAERTPLILDFLLAPSKSAELSALWDEIAAGQGPPTYALDELIAGSEAHLRIEARFGLTPGTLAAQLQTLHPQPVQPLAASQSLYRLGPTPP